MFNDEQLKLIHIIFSNTQWRTNESKLNVIANEIIEIIEKEKKEEMDK